MVINVKASEPKSVCVCGHTGDGPNSQHADIQIFDPDGVSVAEGHGACRGPACDCRKFTWSKFTEYGERLGEVIAKLRKSRGE